MTDVIEIDSGRIRGTDRGDVLAYLGIPYAAPPLGDLRWMPPRAPESWTDIKDCTTYGNDSLQTADLGCFSCAGGDEDCLFLNVFVGKRAFQSDKKLPVMVWIHGGAARCGTGRDYDPSKMVTHSDAIVVTFNYRLGLLGYFAHPDIDAEGHPFGNYGIMDQQLVLDWVQRNIGAFGGDPGNVTVFGESCGGNSTFGHLISPGSKGKFQHAIAMSGASIVIRRPTFGGPVPLEEAESVGHEFAVAAGCKDAGELRLLPAEEILALQAPYLTANQYMIDGTVIPMHPGDAFRTGQFNRVTFVNGHTADEGTFFAGLIENGAGCIIDEDWYAQEMLTYFGRRARSVLAEYPASNYNSVSEAYAAVMTDYLFAVPGKIIMEWVASSMPTYAYEFDDKTAPSYLEPTTFPLGAAHTYELPYLFRDYHGGAGRPIMLNPLQEALSDKMIEYWTTVSQAEAREAEWPRYDPQEDNFLMLTLPTPYVRSGRFNKAHHFEFWKQSGVFDPEPESSDQALEPAGDRMVP